MKKTIYASIFIAITFITTQSSCVKEKDFPPQPEIEFLKYLSYSKDSADCIISFKDGDGDIGVGTDTSYKPDFILKYFYKNTAGLFVHLDDPTTPTVADTLFYTYRVPNITPDGQYKSLEGEIKAKLRVAPLYHTCLLYTSDAADE